MTSGFSFWDGETWSFVVTLALLLGSMMLAHVLLRKVRFLRESLMPSSVLGGFIALFINALWKRITGQSLFELMTLECLTYHGLGLGFIALSWRHLDGVNKKARHDVFMTSTITVGGYLLQAVAGLILSIGLYFVLGSFFGAGALLPMGYGQGPGQAFNWGSTYESSYGFTYGTSFGLTVAAMGFISACVGGVLYLKKLRAGGKYRAAEECRDEHLTEADYCGEDEIPVSESMDKLTVQFALIFLTYGVSYGSMWLLYKYVLLPIGGFAMSTVNPLLWGFNFLVGVAWASLFKGGCRRLRQKGKFIHREYANNFMLNRISGLMFDLMVVASIAAIDLSAFTHREFWLPLLLLCVVGAFVTFWYTRYMCRRLFPTYSDEMFLVMYGMLTGTASTGIILLRQIDPLFKTPASHNVIYQNLWSIVLGAPMLLMLGFIPKSLTSALICLGALTVLAALLVLYQHRQIVKKR